MTTSPMKLTGPQQAAAIIAQLDHGRAGVLLSALPEHEVVLLMAEVARLPTLSASDLKNLLAALTNQVAAYREVRQGGIDLAQRWLNDRLGRDRAGEVVGEIERLTAPKALAYLERIEPSQISAFLADEHPQTVGVVLAHVHHEQAARVLDHFDPEWATEIVRRMATLGPLPAQFVQRLSDELERRLATLVRLGLGEGKGGVAAAAAVLNNVDRASEKAILSEIEADDWELAEAIRNEMFVFDDVVRLDDRTLQIVLRSVLLRDVALSLKTATPEVVDRFIANMSDRAAEDLAEEIQSLGPQRLSAVETAQAALVRSVRELAEEGTIMTAKPNDEVIA